MPLQPFVMIPGICKVNSDYASGSPQGAANGRMLRGRFIDGDHIRFVAGFPEKIGGWTAATSTTLTGVPRALKSWRTAAATPLVGVGTSQKLYTFDGKVVKDITPRRLLVTGTLATNNAISATLGSNILSVSDPLNQVADGDRVFLNASETVGGLTIDGWYVVSSRSSAGYNVTLPFAASFTDPSGGGVVQFSYPRVLLTDPFTTVADSTTVTVVHTAHGASTGDIADYSDATAVGGLTIDGEYQITVVDVNTYTIVAASAATSSATGGGVVSVVYDITIQALIFSQGVGYGQVAYGSGVYGTDPSVVPLFSNGWTLAPYGSFLLAAPIGGTIYVYDPSQGGRAYPLANAPTGIIAMFVTPERFVVALGTTDSTMRIAWADQDDFTNWTSTAVNTANSGRNLQGGSLMVGGLGITNGVSLIFSDQVAFTMSYTGDNNVYATLMSAAGSGLLGPYAVVTYAGAAFWMSDRDFWMWNGSTQPLPSDDIRDYVFTNINKNYFSKCFAGVNRAKKEVWFFYVSAGATEVDRYVIYHIDQSCWSIGSMTMTAWTDAEYFPLPMTGDATGTIFYQEVGTDADGQALDFSITFAPIDVSNGTANVDVFGFLPDFERLSKSVDLTVNTRYYPQDPDQPNGPFTISADDSTPRIDLRADGKMVGFELNSSVVGSDFRLGVPRLDVQPSGARR